MRKSKVYIKTFGCQMNERDSQAMEILLAKQGYDRIDRVEDADLILFNTCTIRDKAYHKAMSDIGRARQHKEERGAKIGICGCAAQQSKDALLKRFDHVDFVLGPDQIVNLPRVVAEVEADRRSTATELIDDPGTYVFVDGTSEQSVQRGAAFVTIMKGCNYACSYCIVPSVRGKEVCRAPDEILQEVERLVERGVQEVTLLGQNVADYKSTHVKGEKAEKLGWLVRRISAETGIKRIRFTSPHPRDIDDDLIAAYGNVKTLCGHIHLPVQSGNNRVLKKMKRGYTRARYLELVEKLRSSCPDIAITTDIIVGFPTETKEEFLETVDVVKQAQFDQIFAFAYSPRPGTYAATSLEDDVPLPEKQERLARLLEVQARVTQQKNEAAVGTTCEVLVAAPDRVKEGFVSGRNEQNRIVNFSGGQSLIGSIVSVKITKARANSLEGEYLHG